MNAEDLLLFVDKYVCGMPKNPPKTKALHPMLLFITVSFHCVSWVLDPHSRWCCGQVPSWAWLLLPGIWGGALVECTVEADVNPGRWQR